MYYVGRYDRKMDDRMRVYLPHGFPLEVGDFVYAEQRGQEIRCYDSSRFDRMAKKFSPKHFADFRRLKIEKDLRLVINGDFDIGRKVVIEGRGDYFSVFPSNQRKDKK